MSDLYKPALILSQLTLSQYQEFVTETVWVYRLDLSLCLAIILETMFTVCMHAGGFTITISPEAFPPLGADYKVPLICTYNRVSSDLQYWRMFVLVTVL